MGAKTLGNPIACPAEGIALQLPCLAISNLERGQTPPMLVVIVDFQPSAKQWDDLVRAACIDGNGWSNLLVLYVSFPVGRSPGQLAYLIPWTRNADAERIDHPPFYWRLDSWQSKPIAYFPGYS